jgi:hypothetical protein
VLVSIFQKIDIIEKTKQRLLLRELPRLEWIFAGIVLMLGINMAVLGLNLTAAAAIAMGVVVAIGSRVRVIVFDAVAEEMVVVYQYPLRRLVVNSLQLEDIRRAYLRVADDAEAGADGATQVVLVTAQGEMGLSVYSKDQRPWKEALVFAINEFLHTYRQQKEREHEGDDTLREAV